MLQLREVVVKVLAAEWTAARRAEVVWCPFNRDPLAGDERIVVVIHDGASVARQLQLHLFTMAAGEKEIRMPANSHGQRLMAHVLGGHRHFEGAILQPGLDPDLRVREPMAIEVTRVQDGTDP